MPFRKDNNVKSDFSSITIKLSSPDEILERSYGEVKKPETINYRTYKPEMDGLFCERIFGPTKDFECYCGKYKRIRYKGIICDRCGVEVTEKKVRRERMGHIKLVVPVVHIWYFKSLPNKIAYLLGLASKKVESVIYYERYAVIQPGIAEEQGVTIDGEKRTLEYLELLTEDEYLQVLENLPAENRKLPNDDSNKFIAKMGGEAIRDLLQRLNLDELSYDLRHKAATETSRQRKAEALKRLSVIEALREANQRVENNAEWMVIDYLPVIPPELRPLVPLDGGRFASSDLNDLYRRVIIRNNRLKRLLEIKAPEVILRNEKRMLQEAVDSLFDNSRKSNAVKAEGGRALKSLSDVLKGKQGRFRQNLLGKRVDYSGRSVIVVGPNLKLHECGIPKNMAAELYKPFIIRKLIERGIVKTVKSAKKLVDKKEPVIYEILENIMAGHPVLLNRAPTLHRLSIQAFQPKLIEGKAIQLHPLACTAFNADFDGDQMAVHLPIGNAAILEAQLLMLASHNILNPQNGTPIALPSQDMVLGLYYMTKGRKSTKDNEIKGNGMTFYSPEEVVIAFNEGRLSLNAFIKVRVNVKDKETGESKKEIVDTVTGRILFNDVVPEKVGFINELLTKKTLRKVIGRIIDQTSVPEAANFLDEIKTLGFYWSYKGGLSFNIADIVDPGNRQDVLSTANEQVQQVWDNYNMGFITENERYNQVIDIWTKANTELSNALIDRLTKDKQGFNSVYMMLDSGARGSKEQIRQLGGMRGLMAKPRKSGASSGGEIIENPILSNLKNGLSVLEYFISTHGARKGLADTALKTADAGYLTRRLVDVSQDVVITQEDCGTLRGIPVTALKDNEDIIESLYDRIVGRTPVDDVIHPKTDKVIVEHGELITPEIAEKIEEAGIDSIDIRSVLTCESEEGVCVKCYGVNLAYNKMSQIGDAVGIMAAQSIGEPGTQLTLRTFHQGGTASAAATESSIEAKYDGVIEFDGVRTVKSETEAGGKVNIVIGRTGEIRLKDPKDGRVLTTNHVTYGATLKVKDGAKVEKGDTMCNWDPFNAVILTEHAGEIQFEHMKENVTFKKETDEQTGHIERVIIESKNKKLIPSINIVDSKGEVLKTYNLPVGAHISIEDGTKVKSGKVISKMPRQLGRVSDITGGLPRVTELFEARNPSNPATVSAIDGIVSFGRIKRGKRELIVESKDGTTQKYLVSLSKHILVQEGDYVKAGMALSDGAITPKDILDIKGPFAVQNYLVNEIQEVYRLQGVKINDKHIETIVRQMMGKVTIVDPGDTRFLEGDEVDKIEFNKENETMWDKQVVESAGGSQNLKPGQIVTVRQVREENSDLRKNDLELVEVREAIPATSQPLLLGITRASLGTKSWISAASFQETTKVLSTATIGAKKDDLDGLKENVIVGHLIPAGTGMKRFRDILVGNKEEVEGVEEVEETQAD